MIKKYYNKIKENGIADCMKYFIIQFKKNKKYR